MKKEKKKLKKRLKYFSNTRRNEMEDTLFKYFGMFCTLFGLAVLLVLLYDILRRGLSRINWSFFQELSWSTPEEAGIFTAIIGTLWIMVLTTVIALPIGVGAGLYLEEYNKKSKFANFLEINIANLAGVPSIIYGLLGLEIFSRTLMLGESILAGSLTLALLILPIIIVSTREALKAVPYSVREASYGLGASKWQTIWHQVLPASGAGIFTGVILAISRAIGETAPLIVIGALTFVSFAPSSMMDPFTVLPIQIFNWVSRPEKEFSVNAAAAIIVLMLITFIMNGLAIYLRYRWQKKINW